MTSFSTNDSIALERSVETSAFFSPTTSDIQKCVSWITENNFKKVCLQFPDQALGQATEVSQKVRADTGVDIYVLADTSYSSCCVDSVAAAHVQADSLVHFGPACLTPHSGIPVLYIFQSSPLDVGRLCGALRTLEGQTSLFYETQYHCHLAAIKDGVSQLTNIDISEIDETYGSDTTVTTVSGRRVDQRKQAKNMVFVGSESMLLTNMALTFPGVNWYIFSDSELKPHTVSSNRLLMKRLHLVEKIKDANSVGILVATLSVEGTLRAVDRIKMLCKNAGKKCYTVAVGRPNVAKLANFPEIDVFVLVSCPENQLLLDTADYYQAIVSIFEVELAFGGREWSTEYSLDFRQVQQGGRLFSDVPVPQNKEEEADVSLLTGKIRNLAKGEDDKDTVTRDLVEKSSGALMLSRGAQFLAERSWSGLEQKLGETAVEKAVKGRSGIALGYESEGSKADGGSKRKLKILCLHGYRQDATKLRQQTGALRKILKDIADLEFTSAPFEVPTEGPTSRSWWFTKENSFSARDESKTCQGLQESIKAIEDQWKAGQYDGLLGFSQGACLVSLFTSLSVIRPYFVVVISGFKSLCEEHSQLYPVCINIPSLHVFGETDQVIPCQWSEQLASLYENSSIIRHPGGHFVPGNSSLKAEYHKFLIKQQELLKK